MMKVIKVCHLVHNKKQTKPGSPQAELVQRSVSQQKLHVDGDDALWHVYKRYISGKTMHMLAPFYRHVMQVKVVKAFILI